MGGFKYGTGLRYLNAHWRAGAVCLCTMQQIGKGERERRLGLKKESSLCVIARFSPVLSFAFLSLLCKTTSHPCHVPQPTPRLLCRLLGGLENLTAPTPVTHLCSCGGWDSFDRATTKLN